MRRGYLEVPNSEPAKPSPGDVAKARAVPEEALEVARSIEDERERGLALRYVAPAVANWDPDRALEMARSIEGDYDRVCALTKVAQAILTPQSNEAEGE